MQSVIVVFVAFLASLHSSMNGACWTMIAALNYLHGLVRTLFLILGGMLGLKLVLGW